MESVRLMSSPTIALTALALSFVMALDGQEAGSSAATRTVTGHEVVHYKNTSVPANLSGSPIAAFVPNGTGGYNQITGAGTSTGTFRIPNVPTGFYLLQLGYGQYLWTSNTTVNADSYENYRSTAVGASTGTTLTLEVANLNAWQDTDYFETLAPNSCGGSSLPAPLEPLERPHLVEPSRTQVS